MSTNRFSDKGYSLLKEAGWFPNRNVLDFIELPSGFDLFPAAANVISEFGGLEVGKSDPGIEQAQSIVTFEPKLAAYENDKFEEYSEIIRSCLYPLGEVDGDYYLAIDTLGRVFLVMANLLFVDDNFDKALDKLLIGIKSLPVDDDGNW